MGQFTKQRMLDYFESAGSVHELVGMEVELAVLREDTGRSAPFDPHIKGLLNDLAADRFVRIDPPSGLMGKLPVSCGGTISLEHGGAIEYATPPCRNLHDLSLHLSSVIPVVAKAAQRHGMNLVANGVVPFDRVGEIQWIPRRQTRVLREYFTQSLGSGISWRRTMAHSLGVHVTIDYGSQEDLLEKVRVAYLISPTAAALFANSPIVSGRPTELLSNRCAWWMETDCSRCGMVPCDSAMKLSIQDLVRWPLNEPMIFRSVSDGSMGHCEPTTFRNGLQEGWPDGTKPSLRDWEMHLSQMWPDVRVRKQIEMRVTDTPPFRALSSVPAFWLGLLHWPPARQAAIELLEDLSPAEYMKQMRRAARLGMQCPKLHRNAKQLVRLARQGLLARVESGVEHPNSIDFLRPVEQLVENRETFADQQLRKSRRFNPFHSNDASVLESVPPL